MIKRIFVALALVLVTAFAFASPEVYFSPNGGSEAAIVKEIGTAKHSLYIGTYQLTNARDDPTLAAEYVGNWRKHESHAEKY